MDLLISGDPRFDRHLARLWERDPLQYPRYSRRELEAARLYAARSSFEDRSALVLLGGEPVAGILLTVETVADGGTVLSAYGRPIHFLHAAERDAAEVANACRLLNRHFTQVYEESAADSYAYRDHLAGGVLSPFAQWLLREAHGRPEQRFAQILDLSRSVAQLLEGSSKSNRRYYRKAAAMLKMEVIEGEAATDEHIEAFRSMHTAFRGRQVRSAAAWHAILEAVRAGEGFFVFGFAGGTLAACDYFAGTGRTCYSAIGALAPGVAERHWGHATVWRGVFHARQLGCVYFDVGERLYAGMRPAPSDKYLAISDFKAGFGGAVVPRLDIRAGAA
ncbi:GNAT family N-acetyltransferase [Streptomyces sp. NPDC007205]|uniref:GNAT family N-acetyltransferase n=1 Tax=Streptomyces sp. NPDC007205 TaxID=3154316 RepID=UPI0033C652B2